MILPRCRGDLRGPLHCLGQPIRKLTDLAPPSGCLFRSPVDSANRFDAPAFVATLDFALAFDVLHVAAVSHPSMKQPLLGLAVRSRRSDTNVSSLARTPVCPSIVSLFGVYSRSGPRPSPLATRCQSRRLVPSSWSLTTATAYSTKQPAGLLHPASDPGVRLVAVTFVTRSFHRSGACGPLDGLVPEALHTLRRIPLLMCRCDVTISSSLHAVTGKATSHSLVTDVAVSVDECVVFLPRPTSRCCSHVESVALTIKLP
jgi:hypothetical protein